MKELKQYEKACDALKDAFLESLYPDSPESYEDHYWVGDEIGGVLAFGDWFVHVNDMADYFRYGYTPEEFVKWYDQWVDGDPDHKRCNMKNFKKLTK